MNFLKEREINSKKFGNLIKNINSISSLKELSITQVSKISGLSFKETELGLNYLLFNYNGYLNVKKNGEIIFVFPEGFKNKKINIIEKFKDSSINIIKGISRVWISFTLVFYIFLFILVIIFLFFLKNNNKEENSGFNSYFLIHSLFRLILDAFYWSFHPFSPFNNNYYKTKENKEIRFYEKVNNFFFGPSVKKIDLEETKKIVINEIINGGGSITIYDIIRVTGMSRKEANSLISNMLISYEGDIFVLKDGTIIYKFLKFSNYSCLENFKEKNIFCWEKIEKIPYLTNNSFSSNILISSFNFFNFFLSSFVIYNGLTLKKINYILTLSFSGYVQILNFNSSEIPILLGWIPFFFSILLFVFPAYRYINSKKINLNIKNKNGQIGILKSIYENLNNYYISEKKLISEYKKYSGQQLTKQQFIDCLLKYGGEIEISETGEIIYKFNDLYMEMENGNKNYLKTKNSNSYIFSTLKTV